MIIYNEIDPFSCVWLRNLSDNSIISAGNVIECDIARISAVEIQDAAQFHAFAGIGVWSHALYLANWPVEIPVWTGSCPCQPFSVAGKRKGTSDARHLWPEWLRLIRECVPPIIFGEQVASPDGRRWLDTVSSDLEALGYAVGAADLCAAGVGAPHIRQRLYFGAVQLANTSGKRRERFGVQLRQWQSQKDLSQITRSGGTRGLANTNFKRSQRRSLRRNSTSQRTARKGRVVGTASSSQKAKSPTESNGATRGFWKDAQWIPCKDLKKRPIESSTFPLVDGTPQRVGRLRAYGNAIVPQVAATFIEAFTVSVLETVV